MNNNETECIFEHADGLGRTIVRGVAVVERHEKSPAALPAYFLPDQRFENKRTSMIDMRCQQIKTLIYTRLDRYLRGNVLDYVGEILFQGDKIVMRKSVFKRMEMVVDQTVIAPAQLSNEDAAILLAAKVEDHLVMISYGAFALTVKYQGPYFTAIFGAAPWKAMPVPVDL